MIIKFHYKDEDYSEAVALLKAFGLYNDQTANEAKRYWEQLVGKEIDAETLMLENDETDRNNMKAIRKTLLMTAFARLKDNEMKESSES